MQASASARSRPHPRTPAMTTDPLTLRPLRGWQQAALASVVACALAAAGCDRPIERSLEAEFGPQTLFALTNSLNDLVDRGDLTSFDTGRNDYAIRLPGSDAEARFSIDLARRTIFVPFGFAEVQLNGLRLVHADAQWDVGRQALRVELDISDAEEGVLAEVHTLVGVEDMAFYVSGGKVTVFLSPVAQEGRLGWDPVDVEIAVNTDDAVPAVRGPLRDALRDVERDIEQQLRPQFEEYHAALADWLATQLSAGARLRRVEVTTDRAAALADPGREDTNGDGRVDISDLVAVARSFGRPGIGPEDVNGDGRVDIADLVAVAIAFGR